MNALGKIGADAELSAVIIRADGSHREAALSKTSFSFNEISKKLVAPMSFWKKLYHRLRSTNAIPVGLGLAAFIHYMQTGDSSGMGLALVTTAGVNLLAADFVSGASTHIAAFNFHDSGTGTTAAATSDSALGTQAGPTTRATGTQSTPTSGQYRSVGTISYSGTLAITEWGLFSQAAQGGTLWDRRVFAAINVVSGDSCQYTYTVTVNAGGS
jgi:hypothetical protein